MNTIQKSVAALGLAALAFGALAGAPASAQVVHPLHHQMKQAAKLDHKAAVASAHGHSIKAAKMRAHASRLRSHVRHGY